MLGCDFIQIGHVEQKEQWAYSTDSCETPMGGAADFKVGYKTGFASGASKKNCTYFSKCGVQASKYQ